MKMYLWEMVDDITYNYHSGGGVVTFANNIEEAVNFVDKYINDPTRSWVAEPPYLEGVRGIKPDLICEIKDNKVYGKVILFPDAGCC